MPVTPPPIQIVFSCQAQINKPKQLYIAVFADDTTYAGILNQVKALFAKKLHISAAQVQPNCSPKELGADTLQHIELIMDCERHFNITIPDAEAEKLIDVNDIVLFVQRTLIRISQMDQK